MKNIIIAMIIMLSTICVQSIMAHEHHHEQDSTPMSASEKVADVQMKKEMAEHQQMEAVNAFPNYHPLIVHFPIVLLLIALVFQLLSFLYFKKEFSIVTLILLFLGVLTSWLASNPLHAMPGELTGRARDIFEVHERMASYTWWFSLFAFLIKIISHFFFNRKVWMEVAATLFLILSAITVSIAGHHGSMLVHMEGVGPMGKYLDEYRLPDKKTENTSVGDSIAKPDTLENKAGTEPQEEDHHVGELGKGPHGGTIEEADPNHIEIVGDGKDLVFYLLDGAAKPMNMKDVTGNVRMQYENKTDKTIELMEMSGKQTAMDAIKGSNFKIVCTLKKGNKSYSASFSSSKDLPLPR